MRGATDDANRPQLTTMAARLVRVDEPEPSVALLTLDDQAKRNAITRQMRDEIVAAFAEFEQRSDVRAVVITGAGPSFCAGADLADLATGTDDYLRSIYDAFLVVARSPLPTVAAVNGHAVGAGLNLALACDVRVAARGARFATGFVRLGLHPGGGSTWMMQRLVGPQMTAAMTLMGETLDGEGAEQTGLVLRCVDDGMVVAEGVALGRRAALVPAPLAARVKQTLRRIDGIDALEEAVEFEFEAQAWSARQDFARELIAAARGGPSGPATGG